MTSVCEDTWSSRPGKFVSSVITQRWAQCYAVGNGTSFRRERTASVADWRPAELSPVTRVLTLLLAFLCVLFSQLTSVGTDSSDKESGVVRMTRSELFLSGISASALVACGFLVNLASVNAGPG